MTEGNEERASRRLALSRRTLSHGGPGVGAAALAFGAGGPARVAEPAAGFSKRRKLRFIFVNRVTTKSLFVPTQHGLGDACAELGCRNQ